MKKSEPQVSQTKGFSPVWVLGGKRVNEIENLFEDLRDHSSFNCTCKFLCSVKKTIFDHRLVLKYC